MKTIKLVKNVLILVIATISIFGCSSGSSSNTNDDSTFYVKCKINGVQFTCTNPYVINSLSKSVTGMNYETNGDMQESVSLMMPLNVTVGTYTITEEPSNIESYWGGYNNFNTDVTTQNSTGTMTITQVTPEVIKGTFSFTSPDYDGNIITVTEGAFRAENIQ